LVQLLVSLFWLIALDKKRLILVGVVWLISLPQLLIYFPISRSAKSLGEEEESIRVLSYNVCAFGFKPHTKTKPNAILQYIKSSGADIVCLQEAMLNQNPWAGVVSKTLRSYLDKDYPYIQVNRVNRGGSTLALLSKYPITETKEIPIDSWVNGAVAYKVLIRGEETLIINVHLESFHLRRVDGEDYLRLASQGDAVRLKDTMGAKLAPTFRAHGVQANVIHQLIQSYGTERVIVCGDFNDTPLSYTRRKIAEGLKDAFVERGNGFGFTLIFMLHFTVATKQPAMTAARFAEAVERNPQDRNLNMKLAQLLVDVFRSQSVAVLGNVMVAISLAALIAFVVEHQTGTPLLNKAMIEYQLHSIDPLAGSLWFAAIAGVWLFCSGIISGFFDNRSNYLNLKMRLRQHPLLKRILTNRCRAKFADYIHDNYGSIMGNLCFGMLLGLTGVIGYLIGLPLDIRHVAFSSANVGYIAISGDFGWALLTQSIVFVLLIGLVNLIVSFALTLWIALRSLNTEVDNWCDIWICVWQILKQRPLSLFLPVQLEK